MSDDDDEIRKLLRQPATTNLTLLLVLGFVLVVVTLLVMGRADYTPRTAHAIVLEEAAPCFAPTTTPCNSIAPPAVFLGDTN
jgi:hypothetical protein